MKFLSLLLIPFFAFAVVNPPERESDPNYVSGDGFRAYANHVYDELDTSLNPAKIKPKQVVFVRGDYAKDFFEKIHPKIKNPYILITHNSDDHMPGIFKSYLDDEHLIAWFAIHYDGTKHPKIQPLPLGISNFTLPYGNLRTFKKVLDKNVAKEHLVYMNMTIQTNLEERLPVFRLFAQAPFVYRPIKKVFEGYLTELAGSKFTIAPWGIGIDTYRLWESLYVGTIPIVRTSTLDPIYEGLPVLIIKDWKQVTEAFLEQKYLEFAREKFKMEKLHMNYWTKLIDSYKNKL